MNPIPALLARAVLGASLLMLGHSGAVAQDRVKKPPPRLAPNASESSRIPAGVDSGTPATSKALPLGTPVPPAPGVDRGELRVRSAAAKAAARPKPAAAASGPKDGAAAGAAEVSQSDCPATDANMLGRSMAECAGMTDRAKRSACASRVTQAQGEASGGAPVPLPGTSMGAAATRSKSPARAGCV